MKDNINTNSAGKASILRVITGYSMALFFILMLFSTFIAIPQINKLFETQYIESSQAELEQQTSLLLSFVDAQRRALEHLAREISTSRSATTNTIIRSLPDILANSLMAGSEGRLLLQDTNANVLLQTASKLTGSYTKQDKWLVNLLSGKQPFHFQLLSQNGEYLTFKISVPVLASKQIAGILSGEMTVAIMDVFLLPTRHNNVAIKLIQDTLTITTKTNHIISATEQRTELKELDISIIYISDKAPTLQRQRSIENWTHSALLGCLIIFFLLFIGLVFSGILHREKLFIDPKKKPRHAYTLPALAAVVGVGISLAAFMMVFNKEQAALENELVFASKKEINSIRNQLANYLHILDSMKAFYEGSNSISRTEFNTFVTPSVQNYQHIQALGWVPSVAHMQRADYIQQAKSDGLEQYTLRERDLQGELVTAQARDQYFPIHYVEPAKGNEAALGFDLGANATRLSPLVKALSSHQKVASQKGTFLQQGAQRAYTFIYNPVYKYVANPSLGQAAETFQGFVMLVLNTDDFLAQTSTDDRGSLSLFVLDISDSDNPAVIYGQQPVDEGFYREETLSFAGRSWRVISYQTLTEKAVIWDAWLILIFGVLLSGILAFGLASLIRRREIVEQLVAKRTLELRESEEQFRAVVENAVDGLLTIDTHGIIEKYNKAAQQIFGYTAQEAIGKNVQQLMPKFDHRKYDPLLENINGSPVKEFIGIGRFIEGARKNGQTFPLDLAVSELNVSGTKKYSAIVRDITKRILLEQEREKFIEQLTDSNEELERFAYVCSHDLQEPLRMIRSFSEKLEAHLGEALKDDVKGKRYFYFITDGAARAQALISDILAYSSVGNSTQLLENINIEALINTVSENFLLLCETQKGSITFDTLPELRGNKTQILQLFQNLINNGLKYQRPEAMPHVHISCEDSGEYWTFMIKDNGIGMEERHQKKIFEVFQRLNKRSLYSGTGIGLSICKKIVERHHGHIWVESTKGEGSTFFFTFLKFTGENNE